MRLTRVELESFRGRRLPDLADARTRLLFVGINPGLRAAAIGAHFGGGSNRFYPALRLAGITNRVIDASDGMSPEDREHLLERGVGITSLVSGASARADELSSAELLSAAQGLPQRIQAIGPSVVAFLGITAYRVAFKQPGAQRGRQPRTIGGAQLWVVPNPSGLNRSTSLMQLADAYREAAMAAGIVPLAATDEQEAWG